MGCHKWRKRSSCITCTSTLPVPNCCHYCSVESDVQRQRLIAQRVPSLLGQSQYPSKLRAIATRSTLCPTLPHIPTSRKRLTALPPRAGNAQWPPEDLLISILGKPCRSVNLLRNVRPGLTAAAAWLRYPISCSSSLLVQTHLREHSFNSVLRCSGFSVGNSRMSCSVSNSKSRKVRTDEGPSSLCSATGRPKAWQN
jgi:hypothetical protein